MKPRRYPIPAKEVQTEIIVVNSRFIATASPTFSVTEARAFIQRIKTKFSDASHHVPAFIIGHGSSVIAHCSDDGEPSGTAGRPALAVLQGSGIGDISVVVTRYFGGTKLGTGGLVRAYSDAVRTVLDVLPRAERVSTHTIMLETPYPLYERLLLLIPEFNGRIKDQDFGVHVTLTLQFAIEDLPSFEEAVRELSRDTIDILIIESTENTIMPIK